MKIKVDTSNICGLKSKGLLSAHSYTLCKQY